MFAFATGGIVGFEVAPMRGAVIAGVGPMGGRSLGECRGGSGKSADERERCDRKHEINWAKRARRHFHLFFLAYADLEPL